MGASGNGTDEAAACLRGVESLVEELDGRGESFGVGDGAEFLSKFLTLCARTLSPEPGPPGERYSDEIYRARDVFVRAGLEALAARQWPVENEWLQIGIRPRYEPEARPELCRQVASLGRRLLSDSGADNFFFMNKPPGIRLRFQPATVAGSSDLARVVHAEVVRWKVEGLVDFVEPGVYEPERQLFGGPRSMDFVHALFTVDSLIWLDYHSCRAVAGEAISPAWLVSLAVLRPVFCGLDITGWEDIGVWDSIRVLAGRRLGGGKMSLPDYGETARGVRSVWASGDAIAHHLDPAAKAVVAHHESALLEGAARWRAGYFCDRAASLGPRAAAAFYVIFHWNRAALSSAQQALLAESLSEGMLADVGR